MNYEYFNPNPKQKLVGDCVIRSIAKATDKTWEDVYLDIMQKGFEMKDMPSSNAVWGAYLYDNGFRRSIIPNTCPDCYTIKDFCMDNPVGIYILATGTHTVAAVYGTYFDTWDSGEEIPVFFWRKEADLIGYV